MTHHDPDPAAPTTRDRRARSLLVTHADRHLHGVLTDPVDVATVAAVERLAAAVGSDDPDALRVALGAERPAARVDEVVEELAGSLASGSRDGRGPDSGDLNPDSGRHEVTTDAGLLRTAVRAATATFAAMPYYRARYGSRGERFAGSDSAWLVGLAATGADDAVGQVTWLAGVLAGRGMPTWLLEVHLGDLVAALRRDHSEAAAGVLPAAHEALAVRRRAVVEDELVAAAEARLDEDAGDRAPVARAGALVAAGVADLGAGVVRRDARLLDWLLDPARTTPDVARSVLDVRAWVGERAGVALPAVGGRV